MFYFTINLLQDLKILQISFLSNFKISHVKFDIRSPYITKVFFKHLIKIKIYICNVK